MTTTQALRIEHTIRDMKRAMSRDDDASDSDSSITRHTNRGNKLKRKAKHVREGRLAQADGPRVYKKRILFNDYPRNIISRNPPRVDHDGDVVDSDNDNSDMDTTDAEDDPYRDVRVENILMPLTSAADLDKHPSLSVPYTNQVLEQMVQNVQDMVQREQAALWRMKNVQTQFCGDGEFAPAGAFHADQKMEDFEEQHDSESIVGSAVNGANKDVHPVANWDTMTNLRLISGLETAADTDDTSKTQEGLEDATSAEKSADDEAQIRRTAVDPGDAVPEKPLHEEDEDNEENNASNVAADDSGGMEAQTFTVDGALNISAQEDTALDDTGETESAQPHTAAKDTTVSNTTDEAETAGLIEPKLEISPTTSRDNLPPTNHDRQEPPLQNEDTQATVNGENIATQDYAMDDATAPDGASNTSDGPRRMATRAHTRANAVDTNGQPTPTFSNTGGAASPNFSSTQATNPLAHVHPFFLAPPHALPNPTAGIHPALADEVRRYLSMYVQKQEEVTRQSEELLTGLRKALRLKNTVWDWCRSEGHVGEMSDGEDWIDAEKWGVDPSELRKGEEVEDEDPAGMVVKKTRNRRAAQ